MPRKKRTVDEEIEFGLSEIGRNEELLWLIRAYVPEPECRNFENCLDFIKARLEGTKQRILKKRKEV